jgi:hypothetical protein
VKSSQRAISVFSNRAKSSVFKPLLGVALLCLSSGACTTWKGAPVTPQAFPAIDPSFAVRVTLRDGAILQIESPRVVGDSLNGIDSRNRRPLVLPLAEIQRLETRRIHAGKTVGLMLGLGAATVAAFFIYVIATYSSE